MSNKNDAPKLYKQTLLRLGEMLKILKQGDNPENRNTLQAHCQYLFDQGKKENLFAWAEVMETAKIAIANPENDYDSTTKLIITEIKQVGEKLLKQQEEEITISDKLSALVPEAKARLRDRETVSADVPVESERYVRKNTLEKDLWRETQFHFTQVEEQALTPDKPVNTNNVENPDTIFDHTLTGDLDNSVAELDLGEPDQSLDDWLEDESFVNETDVMSAVFLREQDPLTHSSRPDDLDEINSMFEEGEQVDNLEVDKWATANTRNQDNQAENWEFLDSEQEQPVAPTNEIKDISAELSDLFDEGSANDESNQAKEIAVSQETLTGGNLEDLFKDTIIIENPTAELGNIQESIPTEAISHQPSVASRSEEAEPLKLKPEGYSPLLIYDNFDDLENLIQSDNWQKSVPLTSCSQLIEQSTILYYEDFSQLDQLINSPTKTPRQPNWQELDLILDEELHLTANALSRTTTVDNAEIQEEVSELDRLIIEAEKNQSLGANKPTRNTQSKTLKKSKVFEHSMRVSVKQLDNINNLVGELVVRRNRLEEDQDRLRQFLENLLSHVQNLSDVGARMQDLYERSLLEGALLASRERNQATVKAQLARAEGNLNQMIIGGNSNSNSNSKDNGQMVKNDDSPQLDVLELDRFTGFHLLSQEVIELIVRVRESTSDIQFLVDETEQLGRNLRQVTTQLQEGINQSRMVSFAQNADRLPLPIRKIAQGYSKQVQLKVEGREVLIDKMILEHLWDPLLQLAKNSVTHGIEQPAERVAMGKTAMGTITVRAFLQGPQTVISVSDDGAGIDSRKIKQKAIQKKLITPAQSRNMKEQDVYDLLFHAGFTTKEKADSHAGRGVGLDIVRSQLNEIRGSVSIDSTIGQGTTFTIRLPLTLSIGKALCCLNDNGRIAFPMDGIEDTKDYLANEIKVNAQGQKCILWHNTLLPFRPLSTLLNYNRQLSRSIIYTSNQENETISIVILRGGNNLLAIQVDQVLGQEEIVIKQINGPLPKPKGIAGATVRSDGIIMPIGDVIELIEIAQGKLRKDINLHADKEQTVLDLPMNDQPLVLIVDDSITVREMLSISFSKSGYRVEQARDGQEAWQKLRSGLNCDLVFCDIEMPRMNGLELLQNLQEDENLSDIPVAILSSRGAEKHQRIAGELGASGYLIKPYVEKDLLDSAQRMLQGEVLLAGSTKVPKPKNTNSGNTINKDTFPPLESKSKSTPLVLIIDDSVVVREMLSMTFKKAGYQVEQARDGQDAWDKMTGGLACDVILCDIEMPRMNGLELLARMQQEENLAKIPVAMVTSRGAEKHRKIASDLGAKAYFTKPYLEEELLKATKGLIAGQVLL